MTGAYLRRVRFRETHRIQSVPGGVPATGASGVLRRGRRVASEQELGNDKTKLAYTSEFSPSGRIATFGERVLRAKAKEMQGMFLASFKTYLDKKGRGV